jgi:hypothetical protein
LIRGGGESGLMVRGISTGGTPVIERASSIAVDVVSVGGITNAKEATAGLSGSSQQDIEQFVMSCPQSSADGDFAEAF